MPPITTSRLLLIAAWAAACGAFGSFAVKAIANGAATASACACQIGGGW